MIIADVAATSLYGQLIPWSQLPDRIRAGMARFDQDPATIKVDWALSGPVPWRQPPPVQPGTVHIADSLDQLTHAQDSIKNHRIPAVPFLLAGQMTTADRSRSPAGTESMWAYTHLPQEVHQDEALTAPGTTTRSTGWPTASRVASLATLPILSPGSSPDASLALTSCRRETPTSSTGPSTVDRPACTRKRFSDPCPVSAVPAHPSEACSSDRLRPIPGAACTGLVAQTRRGPRSRQLVPAGCSPWPRAARGSFRPADAAPACVSSPSSVGTHHRQLVTNW